MGCTRTVLHLHLHIQLLLLAHKTAITHEILLHASKWPDLTRSLVSGLHPDRLAPAPNHHHIQLLLAHKTAITPEILLHTSITDTVECGTAPDVVELISCARNPPSAFESLDALRGRGRTLPGSKGSSAVLHMAARPLFTTPTLSRNTSCIPNCDIAKLSSVQYDGPKLLNPQLESSH